MFIPNPSEYGYQKDDVNNCFRDKNIELEVCRNGDEEKIVEGKGYVLSQFMVFPFGPCKHTAQIFQILKKVGVKLYQIFPE